GRAGGALPIPNMGGGPLTSPFLTDAQGYLQGRGQINIGDERIALLPVPLTTVYSHTASLYYTNITPTPTGVSGWKIASPGIQQITVSPAHPLVLFNLDVSLEWDARSDARFMAQLQYDLL